MTRRNCSLWLVLATLAIALISASAVAQEDRGRRRPGGMGGMMGRGGGGGGAGFLLMLLQNEKVQKEIKLIDVQIEEIKALVEDRRAEMRKRFAELENMDEGERREKRRQIFRQMQEGAAEQEKKLTKQIEEILVEEGQMKRLNQIAVQLQGSRALNNPKVLEALGITEGQKEQLAKIREEIGQKMRKQMQEAEGKSQEERREMMRTFGAQMGKEVQEKVMGVLTDEQKNKFKELKGKEFKLDPAELRGGGRGGQGRQGRQGRPQRDR